MMNDPNDRNMTKTLTRALSFLGIVLIATSSAIAQEDLNKEDREAVKKAKEAAEANIDTTKIWTKGGVFQLNFSQVQLVNWAAGGASSISGLGQLNVFANKRKNKWAWDNNLILAYGTIAEENKRSKKTDDRLELNSRLGHEIGGPWYASLLFQFRTQFTEGFDKDIDSLKISNLMAPGYILFGLGFDYKPNDKFSAYLSPVMTKTTFVTDQDLYYGNEEVELYGVKAGENSLFQMGAYANIFYTTPVAENITFLTRLELFSNYLKNPSNIDVNWEMLWTFKVNEWFAATLNTIVIYDDDINIARKEGEEFKFGPVTQLKQTLALGLTAKF